MLNDWKWEKIKDDEYVIKDGYHIVVRLVRDWNKEWFVTLYNDELNITCRAIFEENMSIEEIQWQAVLWVHNQCNYIANSFHCIRNHLPYLRELREAYDLTKS